MASSATASASAAASGAACLSSTPSRARRHPLLSSVCMVAIVRDEASNPAGGVVAYLERVLPLVHSALVVDTGSVDETPALLAGLQTTHRHLHVRSVVPFVSFAHARNSALQLAMQLQQEQERAAPERIRALVAEREQHAAAAPSAAASAGILAAPLPAELPPFRHILVLDADEALAPATFTLLAQLLSLDQGTYANADTAAVPSLITAATAAHLQLQPPSHSVASPLSYPVCLKFSCHCFDSSGRAAPRSNSGLWNPRVFSADARFSFVNTVDDFRFERLLFDGQPVKPECYMREAHLPPHLLQQYAQLRCRETNAESIPSGAAVAAGSVQLDQALRAHAAATDASSAAAAADVSDGSGSNTPSAEVDPTTLPSFTSLSAQAVPGDDPDAAFLSPSSRSLPLLIPMRHFIPNLAGRRKKNQQYQAGGAAARAAAAAAAATATSVSSSPSPEPASASSAAPAPALSSSSASSPRERPKHVKTRSRIFSPSSINLM